MKSATNLTRDFAGLPDLTRRPERLDPLPGQPPSVFAGRRGCLFAPRYAEARSACREAAPPQTVLGPGHAVHCLARSAA